MGPFKRKQVAKFPYDCYLTVLVCSKKLSQDQITVHDCVKKTVWSFPTLELNTVIYLAIHIKKIT